MHRVIVVGSPRPDGRSAALADELFNACIEECPEDGVSIVSVASTAVEPCRGCDACKAEADEPLFTFEEGDPLIPCDAVLASDAVLHPCVIADDMAEVRKHLDAADELIVVTPVYFASAPAQLKALLDRLQPYFWSDLRTQPKRPVTVHVVGEGGDPHGFEPLIGTLRSALSVAGFRIETVLDWVGKISPTGEIEADADEYELADEPAPTPRDEAAAFGEAFAEETEDDGGFDGPQGEEVRSLTAPTGDRAKLSLAARAPQREDARAKDARGGGKRGGKGGGSRKSSGKGSGPAYGRKNTKKKGNGRGGHR